jgi:hypothetical protein
VDACSDCQLSCRVNGSAVDSIDDLNRKLREVRSGAAVALWIERDHKQYVAFEIE